jgi:hypothetical protein
MLPQEQPGYTKFPNAYLDEYLGELSPHTFCVLAYIVRRTIGFNTTAATIPLKQFLTGLIKRGGEQLDKGCGVNKRDTVINSLKELKAKGIILVNTAPGKASSYTPAIRAYIAPINEDTNTSPTNGTTPVPQTGLLPVPQTGLPHYEITGSRADKRFYRNKDRNKVKETAATRLPLDVKKYLKGGKYGHIFDIDA